MEIMEIVDLPWFTHEPMVIFHSYLNLPEGTAGTQKTDITIENSNEKYTIPLK